mmetsp:Transcript_20388/g.63359  ORF Transcript_20388/g.63359 Transcript_20388/m.63359 type:complete len:244 (-) Transcript_20388:307-1038(-)
MWLEPPACRASRVKRLSVLALRTCHREWPRPSCPAQSQGHCSAWRRKRRSRHQLLAWQRCGWPRLRPRQPAALRTRRRPSVVQVALETTHRERGGELPHAHAPPPRPEGPGPTGGRLLLGVSASRLPSPRRSCFLRRRRRRARSFAHPSRTRCTCRRRRRRRRRSRLPASLGASSQLSRAPRGACSRPGGAPAPSSRARGPTGRDRCPSSRCSCSCREFPVASGRRPSGPRCSSRSASAPGGR